VDVSGFTDADGDGYADGVDVAVSTGSMAESSESGDATAMRTR